ncbi:FG-GAP repeat domain-containing protein [Streptomyces sp. NPDC088757]|uniref:FG-GAP repeat domain-containing protein n=1 Tax=Streptomyces sp. NPDC088757 TaxID=3365889 RepID=UPI00380D647D
MAKTSGLKRTGTLSRLTVAAITAALVGTTTAAVAADAPKTSAEAVDTVRTAPDASAFTTTGAASVTPANALYGVNGAGDIYGYGLTGNGGLTAAEKTGYGFQYKKFVTQTDLDSNGHSDGVWFVENNRLYYGAWSTNARDLGGGWNIYNRVFSPANVGGGSADDLLARDGSGVLWLYLGYNNGGIAQRVKVGAGWNAYNQITGKGDLTGDGRADIVARDGSGVLWLYKGTGNYKAPFSPRTRIGAGWNLYNYLVSVGDMNYDGDADLVARDGKGALWLYKGTGNPSAPYAPRVQIGTKGWDGFRLLF